MPASIKHLEKYLLPEMDRRVSLFAKWPEDRLFYEVKKLIKVDKSKRLACVRYEDNVESWADVWDLHLQFNELDMIDEDDILCSVCDGGNSDDPNEIVICDLCQQGYHQKCHEPRIPNSIATSLDSEWVCSTCDYMDKMKRMSRSVMLSSTPKVSGSSRKIIATKKGKVSKKQNQVKLPKPKKIQPIDANLVSIHDQIAQASDDSSDAAIPSPKKLQCGAIVEASETRVLKVAKALASKDDPIKETGAFIESISKPGDDEMVSSAAAAVTKVPIKSKIERVEAAPAVAAPLEPTSVNAPQKQSKRKPVTRKPKVATKTTNGKATLPAPA